MLQGKDMVLAWFDLNQEAGDKPFFKLYSGTGKANYLGEFGGDGYSVDDVRAKLAQYLDTLGGGDYIIDLKGGHKETKQFASSKFSLSRTGQQSGIGGIQQQTQTGMVPAGYISTADAQKMVRDEIANLKRDLEMQALRAENADLVKENRKVSAIGAFYEDNKETIMPVFAMLAGKIMQGNMGATYQGPQIGISGRNSSAVPPVAPMQESTEETDQSELTEEQGERLDTAFFDCVEAMGGDIEATIETLECLAPYILANKVLYDTMIRPELMKHKKTD